MFCGLGEEERRRIRKKKEIRKKKKKNFIAAKSDWVGMKSYFKTYTPVILQKGTSQNVPFCKN